VSGALQLKFPAEEPAPKYPWRKVCALRTHAFIEHVPDKRLGSVRAFACRSCGRCFKFDPDNHRTWAVANDENLTALQPGVSRRWVAEQCAGRPSEDDLRDMKRVSKRSAGKAR
jgi:hypothetical protein